MTKVYPRGSSSSPSSCHFNSEREVFTIWMKSLVLNGNGCTVFNSNGDIIYRIDNYDYKSSNEVHLMDLRASVIFTILKKKFRLLGRWEGYQPTSSTLENKKPWFQVEIFVVLPNKKSPCEVSVKLKEDVSVCYRMESLGSKSSCRIVDQDGGVVAEVKRKQTLSGVVLGEDVLTLVVEPHVDHSLISGLVVVYGLMNHTL